jgi:hypothetical protein
MLLSLLPLVVVLVFIGAMRMQLTLSQPRMESVRSVDIVSLTGSGFCFGIAFGFLIMMLVIRRLRIAAGDRSVKPL